MDDGLIVICPTRDRPERAEEMVTSFRETVSLFSTQLILVVDEDDPKLEAYKAIPPRHMLEAGGSPLRPPNPVHVMVLKTRDTGNLVKATNAAASRIWDDDVIIGHVGDDHAFRSPRWDLTVTQYLHQPGIAYGNDLNVREYLPTAPFISSIIPRTLGWYALPGCAHMFIDNAWKFLGQKLGRLTYVREMVIEHMHPSVKKALPDDGYLRANQSWQADEQAFHRWASGPINADIAKLRNAGVT